MIDFSQIQYDYEYELAAVFVTVVLFIVFQTRRSYVTKANTIFMAIIICDFFAAIFDVISCICISFPTVMNPFWNDFFSLGYLLFYNALSVLFFMYIDAKTKVTGNRRLAQIIAVSSLLFYAFTIISSPWTHLVAYFDYSMPQPYMHGPMMAPLYIIPFAMFIWEIVLFAKSYKNFNKYQVRTSVAMIVAMALSVVVQTINGRLLIGCLAMAIIMYFAYLAFENPAYYTFGDTQCLNQRAFYEHLKSKIRHKEKYTMLAFSIAEYNYFRQGMGGHQLNQLTNYICENLYRLFHKKAYCISEDKFVIILPPDADAAAVIRRVNTIVEKPIQLKHREVIVSFNFCEIEDFGERFTVDEVEAIVEYRLNNPMIAEDSEEHLVEVIAARFHREQVLHAINRAIADDTIQVYFQPIYSVETKHFESAEALIRLNDPELGFINPEEMITIAEENGYIEQIGEIVFRKVCAFMYENSIQKYGVDYIEINLSPLQCMQEDLAEVYTRIMKEYHIQPSAINLEITETAQTTQNQQLLANMNRLNALGVEFSIDDFGSGFASADYLIRLPVIIVKIDKSILWPAMKENRAMIVLQSTIRMLKNLGKHIVVEGVETDEMVTTLTECGADCLQGYYYSKPVPPDQYLEFLRKNNMD